MVGAVPCRGTNRGFESLLALIFTMKLTNNTTLITGASSGIGKACAELFAEAGSNLVLCARSLDKLEAMRAELTEKHGVKIHVFKLDVREREAVKESIATLPEEFSQIDILINNAGLGVGREKIFLGDPKDWDIMIDTNVKGLLYVTRAILPSMVERNSGTLINIGSIAGRGAYPNGNVYCATKAAVRSISDGTRMDVVDTNIRVSTIEPGVVETNFSITRYKGDLERARKVYSTIEALQPEDIADAALYIATRPPHVQINELFINPTCQASGTVIHRNEK